MKIQEIAKLTGVSPSTVSRVFSHHPNIREDVRESLTVEQIRDLVEDAAADCGDYIQVEDSMATGQESDGESYGVAVIYALYSDGNLLYRVAFDPSMTLIGLSVSET